MAKYKISHRLDKTWICEKPTGEFYWGTYEESKKFQNYFKAKAALETLPVETGMYGFPLEHHFMKVEN